MSLDTLHAEGIEAGLARWAANPGPAPEPGFSITSFFGAGAKGVPGAALETAGSLLDATSGFGTILAATGGSAGGMFAVPTPEEQKQEQQAREVALSGQPFDTKLGNEVRRKAAEFAPDPLTAHQADQVMYGLTRFGTKAVTDVALFGGPIGAALLGLEEANTVTQDLRAKGVDTATAAQVGAVQGVIAAGGAVMPIAGRTVAQTLGLVGVGGPGSFMAQEALSKKILEQAGYQDEASLHNPFDPLGLALSTVIPGGFGALHMRGQFRRAESVKAGTLPLAQLRPEELRALPYDDPRLDAYAAQSAEQHGVPPAILLAIKNAGEKSGPTAESPKGAVGVMQFMPGTAKEMGLADRTDPAASIDAAARYLKKLYDAYGSWDAAVAHYNGGGAQAAIVRGGGRPTAKETIGYLDRVQQYVQEYEARQAAQVPEAVDAARVAALNDTLARSLPDTPDAVEQVARAAEIVGESGGRAAEVEVPAAPARAAFLEATIEDSNGRDLPGLRLEFDNGRGGQGVFELVMEGDRLHPSWIDSGVYDRGAAAGSRTGVVTQLYEQAISEAQARGLRFTSDDSVTEAAARVYEALERRGYDVQRNPAARLAEPPEVVTPRYMTDDGSPVFEVRGAPARQEVPAQRAADNAIPPPDSVGLEPEKPAAGPGAAGGAEPGLFQPAAEAKSAPAKGKTAAAEGAAEGAGEGAAGAAERGPGETAATTPSASLDAQMARKLAAEQPDLQVILPGTEEPISLAAALKRIATEQREDEVWAELVRAAGECALSA